MTILQKLEDAARSLPKAQSNVADYVAKHYREVVFMTIEQLAREVDSSTATIMRLATSMGYTGYSDMTRDLKEHFLGQQTPYGKFVESMDQTSESGLVSLWLDSQTDLLQKTVELNDEQNLRNAIDMIYDAKRLYLTGYRISTTVILYLFQGIGRIKSSCYMLQSNNVDFLERMSHIREGDVVLGCVFPRYYSLVPDILKSARDRGAKTVLLTDGFNSPAAPFADILIPCFCETKSFHASVLAAILISDYLIAELAKKDPQKTKESLLETEKVFQEYFRRTML